MDERIELPVNVVLWTPEHYAEHDRRKQEEERVRAEQRAPKPMTLEEAITVLSGWHYEGGVPWTKTEQEGLGKVLEAARRDLTNEIGWTPPDWENDTAVDPARASHQWGA